MICQTPIMSVSMANIYLMQNVPELFNNEISEWTSAQDQWTQYTFEIGAHLSKKRKQAVHLKILFMGWYLTWTRFTNQMKNQLIWIIIVEWIVSIEHTSPTAR